LKQVHEIVRGYPGNRDVFFLVALNDGSLVQLKSNRIRVDVTEELRSRLDDLLGPGRVRLKMSLPAAAKSPRGNRRPAAARNS
jgi:DNA polymerase-3 subunit alpha